MRISDWSSDVCSSDLHVLTVSTGQIHAFGTTRQAEQPTGIPAVDACLVLVQGFLLGQVALDDHLFAPVTVADIADTLHLLARGKRSEKRRVGMECVST